MKRISFIFIVPALVLFISTSSHGQGIPMRDTLDMGPGYVNDIFYSFKNGEISKAERANWDIAFYTARFSAGVITNDGNGVKLYTYPNGDTSAWSNVDTTGLSGWNYLHNSPEYWEEGAFNFNALGHPDYGWGRYNMVDHHVYGDSIYILDTPSGFKKLIIWEKKSVDNIYIFSYANLDGSNEQNIELDVKPFETKNFVYYSLEKNEILDREPINDSWDILFTKYVDFVEDLEGNFSPYIVAGATNNVGVSSNNFYPVNLNFNDWGSKPMDSLKNTIGYDWKYFDMGLFEWTVKDSNYYFVNTIEGDVYKLQFQDWEGQTTGAFTFFKWLSSISSTDEIAMDDLVFNIYPNPTTDVLNIKTTRQLKGNLQLRLLDSQGRIALEREIPASELTSGYLIQDLNLSAGVYILSLKGVDFVEYQTIIVR